MPVEERENSDKIERETMTIFRNLKTKRILRDHCEHLCVNKLATPKK